VEAIKCRQSLHVTAEAQLHNAGAPRLVKAQIRQKAAAQQVVEARITQEAEQQHLEPARKAFDNALALQPHLQLVEAQHVVHSVTHDLAEDGVLFVQPVTPDAVTKAAAAAAAAAAIRQECTKMVVLLSVVTLDTKAMTAAM
jgi:hypothetical protein